MTVEEVVQILLDSQREESEFLLAVSHLRSLPTSHAIPDSAISKAEFLHVLQRRARRRPTGVDGLEQVVARLEAFDEPEVRLVVVAGGGRVTTLVLTSRGQLVGCVTGPDRRSSDDHSSS